MRSVTSHVEIVAVFCALYAVAVIWPLQMSVTLGPGTQRPPSVISNVHELCLTLTLMAPASGADVWVD